MSLLNNELYNFLSTCFPVQTLKIFYRLLENSVFHLSSPMAQSSQKHVVSVNGNNTYASLHWPIPCLSFHTPTFSVALFLINKYYEIYLHYSQYIEYSQAFFYDILALG